MQSQHKDEYKEAEKICNDQIENFERFHIGSNGGIVITVNTKMYSYTKRDIESLGFTLKWVSNTNTRTKIGFSPE